MGCLLVVFAAFFPRIAVLFMWLARPVHFTNAFGEFFLWPLLGVIFLPFTTLMYVILWSPVTGLTGLDFLWLGLAFLLDITSVGGSGYAHRYQRPRETTNS
jgi:hypothetical protein